MQGWIQIHRKLLEWEWYHDSKMVHLFIHLLLSANHEPVNWQGVEVNRGQLLTGLDSLSKATGLTSQNIRTCLKKLEKTGELTSKSTNRFRIITLCNYESYQKRMKPANKPANKQLTSNQQTTNKPANSKQQVNNDNNDNKKEKHLDFVHLLPSEYQNLKDAFGEQGAKDRIANLNGYIGSKGDKYKSHYLTILNWERRNGGQNAKATQKSTERSKEFIR